MIDGTIDIGGTINIEDDATEAEHAAVVPAIPQPLAERQEPAADPRDPNPTRETYDLLNNAYCFFNDRLFASRLRGALVTLQRKAHSYGYFSARRFVGRGENPRLADEIALNPQYIRVHTPSNCLSILVHEQCHQFEQAFNPRPSKAKGYHTAWWAALMKSIGLKPTDNGRPDGRETGYHMDHIVIEGGPFAVACEEFLAQYGAVPFGDLIVPNDSAGADGTPGGGKAKAESKTKFTCSACGFNTWCKSTGNPWCGHCDGTPMVRQS